MAKKEVIEANEIPTESLQEVTTSPEEIPKPFITILPRTEAKKEEVKTEEKVATKLVNNLNFSISQDHVDKVQAGSRIRAHWPNAYLAIEYTVQDMETAEKALESFRAAIFAFYNNLTPVLNSVVISPYDYDRGKLAMVLHEGLIGGDGSVDATFEVIA